MGDRVEEGLYLSWMGGPDLDDWREDLMERFVLDGASEERIEDLEGMTNDEFLHMHIEWYRSDDRFAWECLLGELDTLIKEKFSGYWLATVENFGWQHLSGTQEFFAYNGKEFLQQLLPKTDCHFKIFLDDHPGTASDWTDGVARPTKGLKIQNFHHDSPVGNEWYYLTDIGEFSICSECEKWLPENAYYDTVGSDGYYFCDESVCQKCGEKLYE